MTTVLGIHRDRFRHANGEFQSFSDRWIELGEEQGLDIRIVDSRASDFFDSLTDCNGFLWRFGFSALDLARAKRMIQAINHGMGIPTFPSIRAAWHFEDKIAQFYLLQAMGCPIPATDVLWSAEDAADFLERAQFPFVFKLSQGIQSRNVRLVRSKDEARQLIKRMFGSGLTTLGQNPSWLKRQLGSALLPVKLLLGAPLPRGIQAGYFFAQEFLPGNEYDTRVTIIGNRAFVFRRMNRPDDFRASGSGNIDWNPEAVDPRAVRLAFQVSDALCNDSLAVDVLTRNESPVVAEISYTYASWAVRDCPGHWRREASGDLEWVDGKLRPEDAIFEDFVGSITS